MANCRYPNEKLTRKEALKGMTLDAAYASFQEHEIGSLQVGKKADFVVFDRDFVGCEDEEACDGSEILEAKVKAVVIDGMVVWGKLPRSEIWKVIHELFGKLITCAIRSSETPLWWCEILRTDVLKCTIVSWIFCPQMNEACTLPSRWAYEVDQSGNKIESFSKIFLHISLSML